MGSCRGPVSTTTFDVVLDEVSHALRRAQEEDPGFERSFRHSIPLALLLSRKNQFLHLFLAWGVSLFRLVLLRVGDMVRTGWCWLFRLAARYRSTLCEKSIAGFASRYARDGQTRESPGFLEDISARLSTLLRLVGLGLDSCLGRRNRNVIIRRGESRQESLASGRCFVCNTNRDRTGERETGRRMLQTSHRMSW
jgi:hypothetical protein